MNSTLQCLTLIDVTGAADSERGDEMVHLKKKVKPFNSRHTEQWTNKKQSALNYGPAVAAAAGDCEMTPA